ncbi:hypothetical protein B0T17DRAFT_530029 [Bombardia bombarda]|uniref:Uncharacterized protein n=1 Tax=Bombardia bombarda TaxID=252184 RepID=A0AA40CAG1_9PEZI|nr:hypothetical protein B0T17DRAFT_530029 [Bombardia bombarda]
MRFGSCDDWWVDGMFMTYVLVVTWSTRELFGSNLCFLFQFSHFPYTNLMMFLPVGMCGIWAVMTVKEGFEAWPSHSRYVNMAFELEHNATCDPFRMVRGRYNNGQ